MVDDKLLTGGSFLLLPAGEEKYGWESFNLPKGHNPQHTFRLDKM